MGKTTSTAQRQQVNPRPAYLVEPPSIMDQTDWKCGFYTLPDRWDTLPCVHFNCGLVRWHGADWLITRSQVQPSPKRFFSRVIMWVIKDGVPVDGTVVRRADAFPDEHTEDPRGFVDAVGRLYLSLTCWRNARPGNFAHQVFGEISDRFFMDSPMHVAYGKNADHLMRNRGYEKNWVWWNDPDAFHFVYGMQPHTVCDVVDGKVSAVHKTDADSSIWTWGEKRGGTPPVQVDGEFFSFFHSSTPWQHPYRRYYMGCYAFSAESPYQMTGITYYPLLFGSVEDERKYPSPIVTFPCGALLRDGEWLVTLGVNDCNCAWIKIPHSDLIERMAQL